MDAGELVPDDRGHRHDPRAPRRGPGGRPQLPARRLPALGARRPTPSTRTLDGARAPRSTPSCSLDGRPRRAGARASPGRWICRRCGRSFHEVSNPYRGEDCPKRTAGRATSTSGPTTAPRPSRTASTVYERQTAPLVGYYEGKGLLRRVDGEGPLDAVYGRAPRRAAIAAGRRPAEGCRPQRAAGRISSPRPRSTPWPRPAPSWPR